MRSYINLIINILIYIIINIIILIIYIMYWFNDIFIRFVDVDQFHMLFYGKYGKRFSFFYIFPIFFLRTFYKVYSHMVTSNYFKISKNFQNQKAPANFPQYIAYYKQGQHSILQDLPLFPSKFTNSNPYIPQTGNEQDNPIQKTHDPDYSSINSATPHQFPTIPVPYKSNSPSSSPHI